MNATRNARTRARRRPFPPDRLSLFPALPLFFLLLLAAAPQVEARQRDEDEDLVRVESDLVLLNVTVTDQQGKYVHKLPRSLFRVLEDGREQTLSVFSLEETPFAAAILLDTSLSMEGRVSLARAAAIRFLGGMRTEDVAAVYNFDTKVERLQDFSPGRDLPPTAYDLNARGQTVLNDAVVLAAKDLAARPEKRRAIIVLSDGADTRSGSSSEKALSAALAANTTIYTVDMADPHTSPRERLMGSGALKNFASKSGGRYVPTPGGRALDEAFQGIVEELSNQYTLGYRPTNRARDGRYRTIEIRMARPDLNARTRKGYRAPKK